MAFPDELSNFVDADPIEPEWGNTVEELLLLDKAHREDVTTNPHNVTKSQVGLGNADNTSDVNKPVSTAQQTALNLKEDVSNKKTTLSDNSDTFYPSQKAVKTAVDAKIDSSQKGSANGVAELDSGGKVPSSQLPSYVDDVQTYADFASLPVTGETGIIYIVTDTNLTYRWSGSAYVEISASLALGETSSTAYRGDRGKTAYDHSQLTSGNPHNVSKSDVGLGNVDNTSDANKPVSTAQQTALDAKSSKEKTINAQTGTTYTLAIADNDKFLTLANGSAIALTVPLNSSVAIPVGSRFEIAQFGDGQVTFTPESGSVVLRSLGNAYKMAGKYAQAYLVKVATNEWSLDGNLTV